MAHELRTLALGLDAQGGGRLSQVADLLMQRFKGLELNMVDGNIRLINQVELAQSKASGLATTGEKDREVTLQANAKDLEEE
eukprot:9561957-Karenia_brevis.AAC.1